MARPLSHGASVEYKPADGTHAPARTFCLYEIETEGWCTVQQRGRRGGMAETGLFFNRLRVIKTEHDWGRGLSWLCLYCTASSHSLGLHAQMHQTARHCPSRVTALSSSCLTVRAEACLNLCLKSVSHGSLLVACHILCGYTCAECPASNFVPTLRVFWLFSESNTSAVLFKYNIHYLQVQNVMQQIFSHYQLT